MATKKKPVYVGISLRIPQKLFRAMEAKRKALGKSAKYRTGYLLGLIEKDTGKAVTP